MKKRAALWVALVMIVALAGGCSAARQNTLMGNRVNLSYAGAQRDGSHQYTSAVGELTWKEGEPITLDGKPFAQIEGRSGIFTFDERARAFRHAGRFRRAPRGNGCRQYRGQAKRLSPNGSRAPCIPGGGLHSPAAEYDYDCFRRCAAGFGRRRDFCRCAADCLADSARMDAGRKT